MCLIPVTNLSISAAHGGHQRCTCGRTRMLQGSISSQGRVVVLCQQDIPGGKAKSHLVQILSKRISALQGKDQLMAFTTWRVLAGHSGIFVLFSLISDQESNSAAPQHSGIITPKKMLTFFSLLSHSYCHPQDLFYATSYSTWSSSWSHRTAGGV